jgi:hypothetical protein
LERNHLIFHSLQLLYLLLFLTIKTYMYVQYSVYVF